VKIAYIFSYFGEGGAEEQAFLLAQKTKESGDEVVFIIDQIADSALNKLEKNNFEIVSLPMRSSFNLISVFISAVKLKLIIKSRKIDIIHSHMLREQSLAILAKILGSNFMLVRTFHRLDQFNWKMKPLMWLYSKFTDAFISITEFMSEYLKKNGIKSKTYLIENGVLRVDSDNHEYALGFIGRLSDEKGILDFIEANCNILRKTKLVVAGDGPNLLSIKCLADKNHLNVELMGRVDNKSDFFSKISVLILPSRTEVLPLAVLEAYSCGLPVVAFKLSSLKGLIDDDNGSTVDFPDYEELGKTAVGVLKISSSFKLANIKKYNDKYSVDKMWNKTRGLYQLLVNRIC
jgi:glycosyltransferase involved in cell wall biosynthesis